MKHITIPELAKMLNLSRVTVYRKVKAGKIPAEKIGHSYVISEEALPQLLRKELSQKRKEEIRKAVKKVVKEYGETLRLLGKE